MRYLIGKIESVHCFGSSMIRAGDPEDAAVANLKYENGVLSTLSISDTMVGPWSWEQTSKGNPIYPYQKELCYWIGGTHGSLELPKVKAWMSEAERSWWNPMFYKEETIKPKSESLVDQLHNFLSIIKGKDAPVCSGKDELRTLSVIEAIKMSARTVKATSSKKFLG